MFCANQVTITTSSLAGCGTNGTYTGGRHNQQTFSTSIAHTEGAMHLIKDLVGISTAAGVHCSVKSLKECHELKSSDTAHFDEQTLIG